MLRQFYIWTIGIPFHLFRTTWIYSEIWLHYRTQINTISLASREKLHLNLSLHPIKVDTTETLINYINSVSLQPNINIALSFRCWQISLWLFKSRNVQIKVFPSASLVFKFLFQTTINLSCNAASFLKTCTIYCQLIFMTDKPSMF